MAEPSSDARRAADLIVAAWLARQPRLSHLLGVSDLILTVAAALDDLALPLAALVEGMDAGEAPESEVFGARMALARAALWRHRGQPPGRVG